MPFVNIKLIKNQTSQEQKLQLIQGITDLIVSIMGRDREKAVITIDELNHEQWAIGGKTLSHSGNETRIVSLVNIKISRGTSNPQEMAAMMKATKELFNNIVGPSDETNYFIIDELNPDAWGFDGLPMTIHNQKP